MSLYQTILLKCAQTHLWLTEFYPGNQAPSDVEGLSKMPDLSNFELCFCLDEESMRQGKKTTTVNPKWKLAELFL